MNTQKTNDADLGDLSFERALEAGDVPLVEATRLYEKGMGLARVCSEMLAAAELKITQIQTAYGEQMRLPPEEKTQPEV